MSQTQEYSWQLDDDDARRRRATSAMVAAGCVALCVMVALGLAGVDWGFNWVLAGETVRTQWINLIAAQLPLGLAVVMKARHVAVAWLLAMVAFVVAPAAVPLLLASLPTWQPV